MALVFFFRANVRDSCRSLPEGDPSPSEVRIPEAPFVLTVGVPLEVRTCGDCGPTWVTSNLLRCHRTMICACPRRTGPKGCSATPLWRSGHSPVWEWRSSGQNMFCKPPLPPPYPDSVRPAPRAHSGTHDLADAKKTRSAQTGFLLYAARSLRSSTHSNGESPF